MTQHPFRPLSPWSEHPLPVPDLAVAVLSPSDTFRDMSRKILSWMDAGVKLIWVIDPQSKLVDAYRADGTGVCFREADTLTGEPVLAGFSCPVADLFRLPGATAGP